MNYNKLFITQAKELERFAPNGTSQTLNESLTKLQEAENLLIEMWPRSHSNFKSVVLLANQALEGILTEAFNVLIAQKILFLPKKLQKRKFLTMGEKFGIFKNSGLFDDDLLLQIDNYKNTRNAFTHEVSKECSKLEATRTLAKANMIIVTLMEQTIEILTEHFFRWIKPLVSAANEIHILVVKQRRDEYDNDVQRTMQDALQSLDINDLDRNLKYLFNTVPSDWKPHILEKRPKSILGNYDHFYFFKSNVSKIIFARALLYPETSDWIREKMVNWRELVMNQQIERKCTSIDIVSRTNKLINERFLRVEYFVAILIIALFVYGEYFPPYVEEVAEDDQYPSISKYGQLAGVFLGCAAL